MPAEAVAGERPIGDVDLGPVASLLGVPTRLRILDALTAGEPLPVTHLARISGVNVPTASEHLRRLQDGGLVVSEAVGRLRLYRLASAEVAAALEALAHLAVSRPVRSLHQAQAAQAFGLARTCYDHLAGQLGVALHDRLLERGAFQIGVDGYALSPSGHSLLRGLGIDTAAANAARRSFARPCLDVTERRDHLAGALGAALCEHFFSAGWILRTEAGDRAIAVSQNGHRVLSEEFGITLRP